MDFLFSSKLIVLIERQSAQFFSGTGSLDFTFGPDEVGNLDIIDREKFVGSLTGFLTDNKIKNLETIIFLSPDVVFQKEIIRSKSQAEDIVSFESQIPLDEGHLALIKKSRANGTIVAATNKKIIEAVVEGLDNCLCKVQTITPLSIVSSLTGEPPWDKSKITNIFSHLKEYELYSFLENPSKNSNTQNIEEKDELIGKKKISTGTLILLVLFGLALAVTAGSLFYRWKTDQDAQKAAAKIVQTPTAIINAATHNATNSAQLNLAEKTVPAKTNLKIKVINGTGRPGSAGKVKDALTAAGFTSVETGNLESKNASESSVVYNGKIPNNLKEEINIALKKLFSVLNISSTPSGNFDVVITTGN